MSRAELEQQRRSLASKLVEIIVSNPSFRQHLIDDREGALKTLGLWGEYATINQAVSTLGGGWIATDSGVYGGGSPTYY